MSIFTDYWKARMHGQEMFAKSSLTKSELRQVQDTIAQLQKKGLPSSEIITALQKQSKNLRMRWKAERVYWTEVKSFDTKKIGEAGEELDIVNYKVILSPHACKTCRMKSEGGRKIFKSTDIEKAGYGHVPPFHPNCYCLLIPTI
jgi:SPP1 gp7 family putative phage head morphogenesis protein